ncbi:MAG: hypothetical protein WC683_01200 [bacterium]
MLRDLRSVKLRPADRARVDAVRSQFQSAGTLATSDYRWLHALCRRYSAQLGELRASRERATRSNALRRMGITRAEADRRMAARDAAEQAALNDLGF